MGENQDVVKLLRLRQVRVSPASSNKELEGPVADVLRDFDMFHEMANVVRRALTSH